MKLFCSACQKVFEAEKSPDSPQVKCPKCGAAQDYPTVVPGPGVVLGDFLIEKLLSRGGMGEVFLAKQISLDRPVALKVLQQKHTEDKEYVESLFKEARAAAKLSHPNIVQAYAVGEDNGIFYFAMEYIRGETFKQILKREKSIEFTRAATVVRDIARALGAAWKEQKLVHQDIKPDNIMLDANGFAKLADLGLAKVATGGPEETADEGDEVLGTPQYISPEQLTGVPTDIRSDIYSLGATFYHFVTGRFPYVADTGDEIARMHVESTLQPPKEVNPALPEALNKIIIKMMAKDINSRYQSAEALIDDLDAYLRSAPPAAAKKTATPAKPAAGAAKAAPVKKAGPPKLSVPGKGAAGTPAKPPVLRKPSVPTAAAGTADPSTPTAPENRPAPSPTVGTPPPAAEPPAVEPPPDEAADAYEEPPRFRRPLKIALSVLASVVLLAVIAGAALVICYKYQVLPDALTPIGKTLSGWIDFSPQGAKRPAVAASRRPAPPPPPVVRTRPEYLNRAAEIAKMPLGTPEQQDKFLAAAEAFFGTLTPRTPEEWNAYRRLRSVFAPVDENRRFVPFRAQARAARLKAIAEVERVRAKEREERELREQAEREAQERRRREDAKREEELRRLQAERRRQVQERAARVTRDVRAASGRLLSGFYAALNGDPQAFAAACEAADMVVLPAGELTPEEKMVIDGFRALRSQLPGELDKLCAFRDSVTDMKDGFWCSLPGAGGLCQIVTLATDGSVTLRRNGKIMRLPALGNERRSFDKALSTYLKGKHALFYYGLMTRRFDSTMKKDAPAGFWKRYIDVFGAAAGTL